jgi:hypothetical protein
MGCWLEVLKGLLPALEQTSASVIIEAATPVHDPKPTYTVVRTARRSVRCSQPTLHAPNRMRWGLYLACLGTFRSSISGLVPMCQADKLQPTYFALGTYMERTDD